MSWKRVHRIVRRVWVTGGLLFTGWFVWSFQAHGVPHDVDVSDARVTVEQAEGSWRFEPADEVGPVGVVFLPGGMVDPRAYLPLARSLAEGGTPVALVRLPWRLAASEAAEREVLERARRARRSFGDSLPWVLAGHSRGAAIATRIAARHPGEFDGLALVGTTHPKEEVDLSSLDVPVLKLGGTEDCVAPRERAREAAGRLPDHTEWTWIEGANHAQFGWYGRQLGDCSASISRREQQRRTVEALEAFLAGWDAPVGPQAGLTPPRWAGSR